MTGNYLGVIECSDSGVIGIKTIAIRASCIVGYTLYDCLCRNIAKQLGLELCQCLTIYLYSICRFGNPFSPKILSASFISRFCCSKSRLY